MPSACGTWSGNKRTSCPLAISGAAANTGCNATPAPSRAAASSTIDSFALRLPPTGTSDGAPVFASVNFHRLLPKYEYVRQL